jgi:hypothetical protein
MKGIIMQWNSISQFNIKLKSGETRLYRLMQAEANLFLELSQKHGTSYALRAITPWYPDNIESFELKTEFQSMNE